MTKLALRLVMTLFITLGIDLTVRSAFAQPLGAGPAEFGVQDAVVDEIGWAEILPPFSSGGYSTTVIDGTAYRYLFAATVSLGRIPHGAKLLGFDIYYYSNDPSNGMEITYCRGYVDSQTGVPKGGECPAYFISAYPPPGPTVGHLLVPEAFQTVLRRGDVDGDGSYEAIQHTLHLSMLGDMGVHSIRPRWLRQVSPAPVTGTFNDVPSSDGAFQFIEAMAASGITAGCGTRIYCPDAFVTRRQMAVFFAKALGLHWSP